MKILDHKDAINRRQDERLIIIEVVIHHVSCLNQTVLGSEYLARFYPKDDLVV
ncbi:MAG: hypothetical protein V7L21_20895 [Nostoc sp.]|uniref:hypothetical protein n=1 Tax=unclassified Nostoc TaxID=2593658 RepID=UPI0025F3C076|nr:hypothetical protein [Nostoc sp. NMS9]MBN3944422.1 hypothetical protein [Nostoc sp. NMS9]